MSTAVKKGTHTAKKAKIWHKTTFKRPSTLAQKRSPKVLLKAVKPVITFDKFAVIKHPRDRRSFAWLPPSLALRAVHGCQLGLAPRILVVLHQLQKRNLFVVVQLRMVVVVCQQLFFRKNRQVSEVVRFEEEALRRGVPSVHDVDLAAEDAVGVQVQARRPQLHDEEEVNLGVFGDPLNIGQLHESQVVQLDPRRGQFFHFALKAEPTVLCAAGLGDPEVLLPDVALDVHEVDLDLDEAVGRRVGDVERLQSQLEHIVRAQ